MTVRRGLWCRVMLCLVAMIIMIAPVGGAAWGDTVNEINNTYVDDAAHVLKSNTRQYMDEANDDIRTRHDVVLVMVTRKGKVPKGGIDAYGRKVFNELKVGDQSKGNGIMMLLMPDASKWALIYGPGVPKDIQNSLLNPVVGTDAETYMSESKWDAGMKAMASNVLWDIDHPREAYKGTCGKSHTPCTEYEEKDESKTANEKKTPFPSGNQTGSIIKIVLGVLALIVVVIISLALFL